MQSTQLALTPSCRWVGDLVQDARDGKDHFVLPEKFRCASVCLVHYLLRWKGWEWYVPGTLQAMCLVHSSLIRPFSASTSASTQQVPPPRRRFPPRPWLAEHQLPRPRPRTQPIAWVLIATLAHQLAARTHNSALCCEGTAWPCLYSPPGSRVPQIYSALGS